VDAARLNQLQNIEVVVKDLPTTLLGLAASDSRTIWLDDNGADYGWQEALSSDRLTPTAAYLATSSRPMMNLLSVLTHELGHLLGLPDLDPETHIQSIMASTLAAGSGSRLGTDSPEWFAAQVTATVDPLQLNGWPHVLSQPGSSLDIRPLMAGINQTQDASAGSLFAGGEFDEPFISPVMHDRGQVPAPRIDELAPIVDKRARERTLDELFAALDDWQPLDEGLQTDDARDFLGRTA
jgi:hypothetical protein